MASTFEAFHLGAGASIDVTEGDTVAERAGTLVGRTFGQAGDPLASHVVTFTGINTGGLSNVLDTDNLRANDLVEIADGAGMLRHTFDAGASYVATLTFVDGSVVSGVVVAVAQMTNGGLYLVPGVAGMGSNANLVATPLRSVTLTAVHQDSYVGLNIDRPVTDFPTCFHVGTLIDTPEGPRAVESLRRGDAVTTLDDGPQPVLWAGGRSFGTDDAAGRPGLWPVHIAAGSLGRGLPLRDLRVSPQHRILLTGRLARCASAEPEVLVAARCLAGLPGISLEAPGRAVAYRHLLFGRHQLVRAEGLATESLLCGPMALRALPVADRAAILAVLPGAPLGEPVRPILSAREARALSKGWAKGRRSRAG